MGMNAVKIFGISSLLLLNGCLATAPTAQRLDILDPFPFAPASAPVPNALVPDFWASPPQNLDTTAANAPPAEPIIADETPESPEETPEDELFLMPEESHIITEDEQAELLSQNQWVRNTTLIALLDTGKKPNTSKISPEERQRRDELNRINMSKEELAKRQKLQFETIDGSASDWRWMHRGVDKLYAAPPDQRANPDVFLRDRKYRDSKYKTLRANAAILMGRDGNSQAGRSLLQLVSEESVPINIRCAAAEVLERIPTIAADDLIPLLEKVKDREVETTDRKTGKPIQQFQPGNTEVWAELLLAIAEKIDPWEHACFLEPFHSPVFDIRLQTAKIWRRKALEKRPDEESLPERFLEVVRQENNPTVRVELIKTLGACQVSNLFTLLERDLRHLMPDVRQAAILALADARCQEAVPIIKDQLRDSNYITRAAAVSALSKLGVLDEVFKLSNDADHRIRLEVAKALSEQCSRRTVTLAKDYLSDRAANVQAATVEAIAGWNIETSGPLLLEAAKSRDPKIRRRATEILAQRGIAHPKFDPEDQPKNQTEHHEELAQIFYETVGIDPNLDGDIKTPIAANSPAIRQVSATIPENHALSEVRRCLDDWQDRTLPPDQRQLIQNRLKKQGKELMPLIDHLLTVENRNIPESLDKVFAEVEPIFGQIEKLKSDDLPGKQRAAAELAQWGMADSPSKLAAKRIIDAAARQTDARVLVSLLSALRNADPELVCQLARPLLQSESVQVRRLSCEMLKQFGGSEDVVLLREALRDPSREVVRGALLAVGELLQAEDVDDSSVVEALKAVLINSPNDPTLRTDAAATLHRLGRSEGTDELRRLAATNDIRIKMYVVQRVSGLGDSSFVPLLLQCLDDGNGTLRNKALEGLPKLTGKDIGRVGGLSYASDVSHTQQQVDRWKAWAKEQGM